ncbi:hypothetical protein [Rosenbergiella australiborealis]|uniref:hypothetical protein n=1 Tax=Rosenbergiella australiborealis TaxID=1544696 RepID=UPI001F4E8AE8|nr:hypothetical protein [Rosenbergiella australiborealis]
MSVIVSPNRGCEKSDVVTSESLLVLGIAINVCGVGQRVTMDLHRTITAFF